MQMSDKNEIGIVSRETASIREYISKNVKTHSTAFPMHGSRATMKEMNRNGAVPLTGLVFEIRASGR